MAKKYPRIYHALKATGHAPNAAQRLINEAQQTDTKEFAMTWIKTIARIARDWRFRGVDSK